MNARWIEQSLVRQRTDSSRGELDVKNGGGAAFILTSRGGAHDPTLSWPISCGRVVIKQLIELIARLHLVDPTGLRPLFFQIAEKLFARFHRHAERAHRINHHSVS